MAPDVETARPRRRSPPRRPGRPAPGRHSGRAEAAEELADGAALTRRARPPAARRRAPAARAAARRRTGRRDRGSASPSRALKQSGARRRAEPVAPVDPLADDDVDRGEVRVGGAQAVGVQDGDVQRARHRAGEGDPAVGGGAHRRAGGRAVLEAAVAGAVGGGRRAERIDDGRVDRRRVRGAVAGVAGPGPAERSTAGQDRRDDAADERRPAARGGTGRDDGTWRAPRASATSARRDGAAGEAMRGRGGAGWAGLRGFGERWPGGRAARARPWCGSGRPGSR